MLTRLRLKNFKAWQDCGEIRLAPLTVLFGTNSAGKTSIPQLLLLLKQTARSPDRQRALQLGDHSYADVVHRHRVSSPLEFDFSWSLERPLGVQDPVSGARASGDTLRFAARLRADARGQPRVERLSYELAERGARTLDLALSERGPAGAKRARPHFELTSDRYELIRRQGRAAPLPSPLRFYGFPDEVQAYFQNAAFVSDLVLELERVLNGLFYVGPLREYPKRLYVWSGEAPDHVGERGDRAIESILAAGARAFSWKPRQRGKPLEQIVAERLRSMGLIHQLAVKPLGRQRREYEVLVKTTPGSPEVKLSDVGFGVSQVLPVIVEAFYVPRRSVVILEQPEIHLHPRVQADLADLFVDAIRAREAGEPRECQFIIESHSEHFLRRLQRRIAEQELSHEDVALYFVTSRAGAGRIEQLDVDEYGNIKNWPERFFGDEMADLVARTEAQARRRTAASKQ